ncbi:unnamed protein product, partial [Iphiclides podalirius]
MLKNGGLSLLTVFAVVRPEKYHGLTAQGRESAVCRAVFGRSGRQIDLPMLQGFGSGVRLRRYRNMCFVECARLHHQDLTLTSEGPCEPIPTVFATTKLPSEEFSRPGFSTIRDPDSSGTCTCPRNANPVCGNDGLTYYNPCML